MRAHVHFVHKTRIQRVFYGCLISFFLLLGASHSVANTTKKKRTKTATKQPKAAKKQKTPHANKPKVELKPVVSIKKLVHPNRKIEPLPVLPTYGNKSLSLASIVRYARKHNPTLVRLRQTVHVLKQREKQAGAWSDIKVGVSGTNFPLPTFNPTKTGMSGIIYSVSQKFPILGRLKIQKELAKFNTLMMEEAVREKENDIIYQIRRIVHRLGYLRQAVATEKELYQLTGQAASVARIKYTVGKSPQQHYLQALTTQSVIRSRMVILVAKERVWRHRLARLMGAQNVKPSGLAPTNHNSLSLLSAKKTLADAIATRGSMRRWKIAVSQAKKLLSFAKIRYLPDVTVQLSVRQRFPNPLDQGAPFISLGVKLPIPSWGNPARDGLVKEAMSRHQLARVRIQELQTLFREQIRITLTEIKQYEQQIKIAKEQTIPLAMQTYRSALSSYQVDKVDFLTLLSNLRALFTEKLKLARLRMTRAILVARLHAIAGRFRK